MVKKKVVEESPSEEEEDEQYHVEVIKQAKVNEEGGWDYLVKWANYSSDSNTWEPEENVQGCDRLLRGFWKNVGIDDGDYPVGHTVYATPSWIEKEKTFFAKNFGGSKKKESEPESSEGQSSDEVVQVPAKRQKKPRKTGPETRKKSDGAKRPRTEELSVSPTKKTSRKPSKATVQKTPRTDDSGDDSDDAPLLKANRPKKRVTRPKSGGSSASESSAAEPIRKASKPMIKIKKINVKESSTDRSKDKPVARVRAEPAGTASEDLASLFSAPSSPDIALATKELVPDVQPGPSTTRPAPTQLTSTSTATVSKPRERPTAKPLPAQVNNAGTSGLTTKQRLAEKAKTLTIPTKVSTSSSVQRNNLAKLSFKKTPASGSTATTPIQESHPLAKQVAGSSRAAAPVDVTTDVSNFVQSPVSIQDNPLLPDPLPPHSDTVPRRQVVPLPRRNIPSVPTPIDLMTVADQFLSTVMPAGLAAPMEETIEETRPAPAPPVAPTITQTKTASLGRIRKKYKWTGELFIQVEMGRSQRLCNALLSDATDPGPNGLRFSICLQRDHLRLQKLHDVADLYMILQACGPAQQFAKLGPEEEGDAEAIKVLASHMRRRRTFTYAPLILDDVEVALMLIFPSSILELCKTLKVPRDLTEGNVLIAALVPWELTHREYEAAFWRSPRPEQITEGLLDPAVAQVLRDKASQFPKSPAFHRALRILKIPKHLLGFMATPHRPYCLWFSPADGSAREPGADTASLRVFLSACKAHDVGYKSDVRLIFVHVGALSTLYKLPALAERRYKRPEIRFYTYGTHETISPDRWGIHEIFPLGGILTFTPSAIIQNIVETYELIKKIDEHPLWQCYILPSVVTMLAKLTCQGESPLTQYDKGEFLLVGLLELIAQGKISLLRAPPPIHRNAMKWSGWQLKLLSMDARELLEECIKTAAEQYSNSREPDLPEAIQKEIARDIWSMQLQPAIMDEFRRFVVVRAKGDRYFDGDKEGVECVSISQFDFKDDFFPSSPRVDV